jgi:hypothetical protein
MSRLLTARLAALLALGYAAAPALAQSHAPSHGAVNRGSQGVSPEMLAAMRARNAAPKLATPAGANVVTVVARDFAFDVPERIPAGLTTLRLVNQGPDLHHVVLVKLEGGKTMGDLFASMKDGGAFPAWAKSVGGPNTPRPGSESNATFELAAGNYAMICVIPAPDGQPHVVKGMAKAITVVAPTVRPAASTPAPTFDVTMTLSDYAFGFDRPVRAGKQRMRILNSAAQGHEFVLVKLAPGKTPADLVQWVEKHDGPPPGEPLGGITDIVPGTASYVDFDLTPGEYGLLCFLPDAKDGKPHFVHGMSRQFTVK